MTKQSNLAQKLVSALTALQSMAERQQRLEVLLMEKTLSAEDLVKMNPLLRRNSISNDAATQKQLMATWDLADREAILSHDDIVKYGFRAFSQNDEDGILLRLFSHIGTTNRYAIEIGSNCNYSDIGIPENLTTNLIINHGWHASIIELEEIECSRMRYFFARAHATQHFHWMKDGVNTYYSPNIVQQMVSPENVNEVLLSANPELEPDLLILDIDGGDYAVMEQVTAIKPRVIVVEFEKRFRDRYSVVQPDRTQFSKRWQQSGAASLNAWIKLLGLKGYRLCTVSGCSYNAFFVRSDVAEGKLMTLSAADAYASHPVFSSISDDFWVAPDESWEVV